MNMIKCIHCGHEDPAFDYAHVCLTGPYALKYKSNWTEVPYVPATEEEEEAWKDLEKKMQSLADASAQEIADYIDSRVQAGKIAKD